MNRLANLGLAALILGLLAIAATVVVPPMVGLKPVSIAAGSMTPTYPFGTIVLIDPKAEPNIGDVITFKFGENTPVTHRVMAVQPDPSGWNQEFITRGDANVTDDIAPVPEAAVVGVVTASIPYAGLATGLLDKLPVQVFLGTLAIGLYWLSNRKSQPQVSRVVG